MPEEISRDGEVGMFFQKYQWLMQHYNPSKITAVYYRELISEVMYMRGGTSGVLGSPNAHREIKLFDGDGKFLGQIGQEKSFSMRQWIFWGPRSELTRNFQEIVEDGLTRIERETGKLAVYMICLLPDSLGKLTELTLVNPHGAIDIRTQWAWCKREIGRTIVDKLNQ